ncbi:2EXR family [Microdochium nivale]|nr:2EXR family [Microdochium nivale]
MARAQQGSIQAMQNPETPFLSRLPVELRLQIYEIYMLSYLETAKYTLAPLIPPRMPNPGETSRGRRTRRCENHLIGFEAVGGDCPPLLRVCRQVRAEVSPIAAQYLRFIVSSEASVNWEEVLTYPVPLTMPPRCPPGAIVQHLHLEWRLNGHTPPHRSTNMQRYMSIIWHRFEVHQYQGTGRFHAAGSFSLLSRLSAIRIILVPSRQMSGVGGTNSMVNNLCIRTNGQLDVLVAMCERCPELKKLEFVGLFEKAWLDTVEERMRAREVKVFRGKVLPGQGQQESDQPYMIPWPVFEDCP